MKQFIYVGSKDGSLPELERFMLTKTPVYFTINKVYIGKKGYWKMGNLMGNIEGLDDNLYTLFSDNNEDYAVDIVNTTSKCYYARWFKTIEEVRDDKLNSILKGRI
jgi:hypothetical protein